MPKLNRQRRNKAVVKRRDVAGGLARLSAGTTVEEALELVMRIYVSEGYRERTISDYRKFWAEFTGVVGKTFIDEYMPDDLRKFIVSLLEKRKLSPVTVNIRLSAVRAIFNRLEAEGAVTENPVKRIRKLKTDQQRVLTLNEAQLRRLFAAIDRDSFAGFRDHCAFMVALKCGLRANELQSLEIADVDFDNDVIMLPGAKNKNRKNRPVPISRKVKSDLMQLIAETHDYFGPQVTHVFTSQFGEPMKDDHLRKRIDRCARLAGLKGECRASLHSLRHTFAVTFLNNGGNVRVLQKVLGHSDLATTAIYLDYSDDQVSEQYRKIDDKDEFDL